MRSLVFRRMAIAILTLVLLLAPAPAIARKDAPEAAHGGSVPMFRGNPARTGEQPGPGPKGVPAVLWYTRLSIIFSSSPAVAGGILYIGSIDPVYRDGGALLAVDTATGEEVWRLATAPGDGFLSSPAVVDGIVYVGSYYGIVIAADAATGSERWRFQAEAAVYSSPAIVDGIVYVGDIAGNLFALDAASGEQRWRFAIDNRFDRYVNSSPAVADGAIYAISFPRRPGKTAWLHALDAATGQERWRFAAEEGGNLNITPAVSDGLVYVVTDGGFLYAVDATDGRERWRFDGGVASLPPSPAVVDGVVYLATAAGELHSLDAASGQERWFRTLPQAFGVALTSAPVVESGTLRWQGNVWSHRASPAVVDGLIYLGDDYGQLQVIGDPVDNASIPFNLNVN
jgi:outer membrane protein assembly factor BamB